MCEEEILGVLGGMGPEATVDFMEEVIDLTPADRDQDHIEMMVVNDPKIPDRTEAILEDGESPVPKLGRDTRKLESLGSDMIAVPCNTFHYFIDDVRDFVNIPIINMIEETGNYLMENGASKVGLLSTSGTVKTRIYHDVLEPKGLTLITPDDLSKEMRATYLVKAGEKDESRDILMEEANDLLDRGADTIIAGCTEIPLVLKDVEFELVNPTRILAMKVVKEIKGNLV